MKKRNSDHTHYVRLGTVAAKCFGSTIDISIMPRWPSWLDRCGSYGLIVRFLVCTGLRWAELAALTVGRVDLTRRRVLVAESVTEVNGEVVWGTPKTHERRSVPLPRFLAEELTERVIGRASDALLFTAPHGGVLRVRNFRRAVFDAAVRDVGPEGFHPHELRHTAASLAIASGADVKIVQQMLGHKTATMTLDLYGHLFPDRLDDIAGRMDSAVRVPNVPQE
ncbi:integrase [Saccharopolyspora lacisalsi]|uniref:Integrase n=1 Tax=Halosaccharopolyspora lacisalsi TaxID=1000566 RepID=A0A839DWA3_9PSEU|nr:site-specific integrase [Halosaccharopolyspora lacisalsi]MBA8825170.1 integrase [Halosaccharopolyspora lacisalsi]